jgi:hypothetical protein
MAMSTMTVQDVAQREGCRNLSVAGSLQRRGASSNVTPAQERT